MLEKVSLNDASGGLLADVLAAMARDENRRNNGYAASNATASGGDQNITGDMSLYGMVGKIKAHTSETESKMMYLKLKDLVFLKSTPQ